MSVQETFDDKKGDWKTKADALLTRGKYKDAFKAYDRAIKINPRLFDVWSNKSNALWLLGCTRDAYKALIKAKELKHNISKRTKRTL